MYTKILIDGIDRTGKSSLIEAIMQHYGYFLKIHYSKPSQLQCYDNSLETYQKSLFGNMFNMLKTKDLKLVFDRSHLGETIYAPLYRKYSGDYVFDMENELRNDIPYTIDSDVMLVLLYTTDFSILKDDGLSFDFNRKEEEQAIFLEAFNKSTLPKIKVDVSDGNGGYKSRSAILSEIFGDKRDK